jgi:hypothetical protein
MAKDAYDAVNFSRDGTFLWFSPKGDRIMKRISKVLVIAVLCAACCQTASAQVAPATLLQIETDNNVRYIYDTPDVSAFGAVATAITQPYALAAVPTFATWITEADITAVNGKPAKGIYLTRQVAINLSPTPTAGQGIADLVATNIVDRILVIMQPDGTPIGSIMMYGLDGGTPPPGSPEMSRQGNFAITGGTGAFLGMRGQFESGPVVAGAVANRNASVREDPAKRRINGGGKAIFLLHLLPMSRPEIITDSTGPAVVHANGFARVTPANPASAGETLILYATGLGPTRPGIDPGKPFSTTPSPVNSPVEVSANGIPADVVFAGGYPGAVDGYHVSFRLPAGTPSGQVSLRLTAAFIAGPEAKIAVK